MNDPGESRQLGQNDDDHQAIEAGHGASAAHQ
jgi:hypothetical protein